MLVEQLYGRVCRVCLEATPKLIKLNEIIREYSLTMLELLYQIVPSLEAEINFPVPHEICETCRNHLFIAYELQRLCMATNEKLYRIWQESKAIETTVQAEYGKEKKEQHVDCNAIDLELRSEEMQFENEIKESLPQRSDQLLEEQHNDDDIQNDFVQNQKEFISENEVDKFDADDDDDDDDEDKPLICLRNKRNLRKQEIKPQEHKGQEKANFKDTLTSPHNRCCNCNKSFTTSKDLSKHHCKRITKALHNCSMCPKSFSLNTLMQKHVRKKHTVPLGSAFSKFIPFKDVQVLAESSQCDSSLQDQLGNDLEDDRYDDVKDSGYSLLEDIEACEENCNKASITAKAVETLKKFSCNECNASFRFQKQLERHHKKHTDAHRFVCLVCSDRFKYPFMLQKHVEKHHPALNNQPKVDEIKKETQEKTNACNYCSAAYTNVGGLAQHMSKKHPEIVPFKCDKCEKTFVVEEHLKIHTNRHMGIKNFKCDLCDKSFSFKFAMKQHMRIHTGDLNYLCTLCGKKFYRPSNLRQHMQRHGDDKPYTCPHCPKRFKCPSDRYIHLMSHQEGKNHVCSTCGSRFSRVDTLHQHQILHTGEKPYKCDQCPMAFPRLMNLNRHLRTHTGEKPYKCKYCDKAYAQSNDLNKHLRTHVGENTYMCTQCPSAFKYQAELRSHEWEHYRKEKQDEKQGGCE